MPRIVWLNGSLQPLESATTSVADHAFLYGDGIFEGIRFYDRKVFKLDEHLDRLYNGARSMGFNMTYSQQQLRGHILATCKEANLDSGYIRLNATRGTGLGLDPKGMINEASIMIMVNTLSLFPQKFYDDGLTLLTSPYRTIPADSLDPRLKCIGRYAVSILAKHQANAAGVGEAMMLNHQGQIAECTGENIFFVKGDSLMTPHPSCGILEGITRNTVMSLAKDHGLLVTEGFFTPYDVFTFDEVFLTGTAAEIIPVISLDARTVGDGKPGKKTLAITSWFKEHTGTGIPF